MGGMSISADYGADISASHAPGVEKRASATIGQGEDGDEDTRGKSEKGGAAAKGKEGDKGKKSDTDFEGRKKTAIESAAQYSEALKREEENFKLAESALRATVLQSPALRELAKYLFIDRTPEGLRIQIIDQGKFSLFPSGSSSPYQKGRDLLRMVGSVISRLSNDISVTGHTDSRPFPKGSWRNNWGLSVDRANVSRSELQKGGVSSRRIARVVGLADRDPFVPSNTRDPRNRRISIVLLRSVSSEQDISVTPVSKTHQKMEGTTP